MKKKLEQIKEKLHGKEITIKQGGKYKLIKLINVKHEDTNFHKIWLNNIRLNEKVDRLSILIYICKYASNENTFIINIKEMAKRFNVTRQTMSKIIEELEELNFLIYKTNVIVINPNIIFKGYANKRAETNAKYFKNKLNTTKEERAKKRKKYNEIQKKVYKS